VARTVVHELGMASRQAVQIRASDLIDFERSRWGAINAPDRSRWRLRYKPRSALGLSYQRLRAAQALQEVRLLQDVLASQEAMSFPSLRL